MRMEIVQRGECGLPESVGPLGLKFMRVTAQRAIPLAPEKFSRVVVVRRIVNWSILLHSRLLKLMGIGVETASLGRKQQLHYPQMVLNSHVDLFKQVDVSKWIRLSRVILHRSLTSAIGKISALELEISHCKQDMKQRNRPNQAGEGCHESPDSISNGKFLKSGSGIFHITQKIRKNCFV